MEPDLFLQILGKATILGLFRIFMTLFFKRFFRNFRRCGHPAGTAVLHVFSVRKDFAKKLLEQLIIYLNKLVIYASS